MALKHRGNYWEATDNSVGYDLAIGVWSSATANNGVVLSSTKTKAVDICCDDGGAALSATAYRAIRGRVLITAAQSGDCSPYGIQGHLKNTAADTTSGNKAGVWGYYEAASGATVAANSAGVHAMIDVPSGATIGGTIGGLQVSSNDLSGTHTAKAACIHTPNPVAGTWDYAWIFGTATGGTAANSANLGANTCNAVIKVRVGSTDGYIPVLAAAPA